MGVQALFACIHIWLAAVAVGFVLSARPIIICILAVLSCRGPPRMVISSEPCGLTVTHFFQHS